MSRQARGGPSWPPAPGARESLIVRASATPACWSRAEGGHAGSGPGFGSCTAVR
ncbi:hypothetical protein [Priestia megaterium]|uniref:hypothetical protein n=1 Tax=Priestia megaterium TaxID=1404 RepID=UPI0036DEEBF8